MVGACSVAQLWHFTSCLKRQCREIFVYQFLLNKKVWNKYFNIFRHEKFKILFVSLCVYVGSICRMKTMLKCEILEWLENIMLIRLPCLFFYVGPFMKWTIKHFFTLKKSFDDLSNGLTYCCNSPMNYFIKKLNEPVGHLPMFIHNDHRWVRERRWWVGGSGHLPVYIMPTGVAHSSVECE